MKTNFPKSRTVSASHSMATLSKDSVLSRKPRFGWKARPEKFFTGFEQKIVFYDCFWHADGKRVLLVGPPPRNLLPPLKRAHYSTDNSQNALTASFHITQSVMILELTDVMEGARSIKISAPEIDFELEIQPNYSQILADKRVMFTISKDNNLEWISAWAEYYQHFHGVDALVLVDNGSTKTTLDSLASALEKTKIEHIFILSMPHKFGEIDYSVLFNPFWANFLQNCINSIVLRRFAANAQGLLNCDLDELAVHKSGSSLFSALEQTPGGLLTMRGVWIESYAERTDFGDHRDFKYRLIDEKSHTCKARKWVLDPKRQWVDNLNVHPYWHWIEGRPRGAKTTDPNAFFWHFKGINNNWKVKRNIKNASRPKNIEPDQLLVDQLSQWPSVPPAPNHKSANK